MWLMAGGLCAAAGVGLLLRSEYEKEQLSVEKIKVVSRKIKKDRRLVFLSDLHDHQFGQENEKLLEAIYNVNPDAVLIGGDMMVSKGVADTHISLELIEKLSAKYPVYYGNGNHENRMRWERSVYKGQYEEYAEKLNKLGVYVLADRTVSYGKDIDITGIDLEHDYYKKFVPEKLTKEIIKNKAGLPSGEKFQILLCHSPLFFSACRKWGADLTLSGHFHGGTIRLPLLGGVMTPQFQFFYPYCAGTFTEGGKTMIVSRGLGTHSINIRINNKPQLVVIDLKRES